MNPWTRTTALLLTVCSLLLAGCASAGGEARRVVWYSAHNPQQNQAVVEAFTALHPEVEVEVLRLVTGELATRYGQERGSGQVTADVVTLSDPTFVGAGTAQDWWLTDARAASDWPADALRDGVANTGYLPLLLGYNTDLVPPEQAPRSWEDLTNPALRGRMLMPDPRNDPAYLSLAQIWSQTYGDDFLRALAAQQPRLVPSVVPGNESLGSGGADVLVPNARAAADTVIRTGAPVELVAPEPTTAIEFYSMIAGNAPNAEPAALLFEFLTTKEGQEAFNGTVGSSARPDAAGTAPMPPSYVPLREVLPQATARRGELLGLLGIE